MRIAITGARGLVGREVVKKCAAAGHHTIQINRTAQPPDPSIPNTEMRTADAANDYDALLAAFESADAVIHLAAVPNPVGKADHFVHQNNVSAAFNGLRAAAERRVARFAYASSVNAVGLVYSHQPLEFPYFPIDEAFPPRPTDAYALAKLEGETAAAAIARWFPFMRVACLRIHQVGTRREVVEDYEKDHEKAVRQLWGWVSPAATARACLLAVERADRFEGCEVFNIVAPDICAAGEDAEMSSDELARKYYPKAEIREGLSGKRGFWTVDKAREVLGWTHDEKE
ncbi:uncharacterized protein THITE_2118319 [Thermothielavioides terrestris NRRL 8126]|uniref:NAD-dependent epimerase/dehydratase domain-containing protein n=2 Tax=Thermothielavioides terrestris TaxID=2587410 RepID=G2R9N7_THETT|nr:uncharacterized protein THITE_2118319 [Thermothielavioides terrestris NRRL 8126]AEO68725.1 hypothetical protein THITE_2118319 [Thermothielavioides terrestris NRRL 8126]